MSNAVLTIPNIKITTVLPMCKCVPTKTKTAERTPMPYTRIPKLQKTRRTAWTIWFRLEMRGFERKLRELHNRLQRTGSLHDAYTWQWKRMLQRNRSSLCTVGAHCCQSWWNYENSAAKQARSGSRLLHLDFEQLLELNLLFSNSREGSLHASACNDTDTDAV